MHDENDNDILFGFYTTRWVRAKNVEYAEMKCLANLKSEPEFKVRAVKEITKVYFEEIIPSSRPFWKGDGAGATWFEMEDQSLLSEVLKFETEANGEK